MERWHVHFTCLTGWLLPPSFNKCSFTEHLYLQTLSPMLRTQQCLPSGLHSAIASRRESKGWFQLKEEEVTDMSLREGLNLRLRKLGTTSLQIGVQT